MATQTQMQHVQPEERIPAWRIATRLLFRFSFVYFSVFIATTQILPGLFPITDVESWDLASMSPIRQIVFWTAAHVFGVKSQLVYSGSGSGDKTFDWLLVFCLLIFSALATVIWSVADRRRATYTGLHKWFRLFVRFALASEMVLYGIYKLIPLQMPFPFLTRLIEPFGNFSPMGVLWVSVGAAQPYETFVGCAETLGGILLFFPRTTMLGALVCLADLTQVFALNMTYDVPVKLFSFHLILLSLFLLAPDLRRLAGFFFLNRTVAPTSQPQLFRTTRANRWVLAAQIVFGCFLLGANAYSASRNWYDFGGGRTKPALYGIWNVNECTIDGKPSLTDSYRWRRLVFDFPDRVTFQTMDDTFIHYNASLNTKDNTLVLTNPSDKNWKAALTFHRTAKDRMMLDGGFGEHRIHMQLALLDRNKFLLVNRGFHWIQEYPFNR